MRIAVLSDLHANVQALEAVMNDVVNQNCEHVFVWVISRWQDLNQKKLPIT